MYLDAIYVSQYLNGSDAEDFDGKDNTDDNDNNDDIANDDDSVDESQMWQ